jgi:predicted metal-binding protein
MSTILTVCDTCKRADWSEETHERSDGEQLLERINHAAIAYPGLTIRSRSCLMGCDFACNVTLQSEGKISYVIGTFEPTQEAADAILDYASKYTQSETGQVPYKTWPQGIKGHFRARVYPDDTA